MDAVKFLEEYKRMCDSSDSCDSCDADGQCIGYGTNNAAGIVAITEKWSKEHSRKTRSDEFLKHYPNATIGYYGVIDICPKAVDKNYEPVNGCDDTSCDECADKYWAQEVE